MTKRIAIHSVGDSAAPAAPRPMSDERACVVAPQPDPAERGRGEVAPERETDATRRDEDAEADVAGAQRLLREHHLCDVDRGAPDQRDVPDDEDRAERRRPEHEPDAVGDVAPVTRVSESSERSLLSAIIATRHRRHEEGDRVDPVRARPGSRS